MVADFKEKVIELIDNLKGVCASYGLGNDGNEFKIITQVFLYKFLNDKFAYSIKKIDDKFNVNNWEEIYSNMNEMDREMLLMELGSNTAQFYPEHLLSNIFKRQNEREFAKLFDDTLEDIALKNSDIFAVVTVGGAKVTLFDRISEFVIDDSKRDDFIKAIINKIVEFSFEHIFKEKYDFYATIFEYLIKDYNSDSGGKYAEYYTPHAVAKIMASILVPENEDIKNVTCYDPSAGSGTLLMSLAHSIGEDKCSIFSQDISQKSTSLLRLNLILNNLNHSIHNIIYGNTLEFPEHKENGKLREFDYIVSNPPFKTDFSDYRNNLEKKENNERFFAGIPKIKEKDKTKMEIYLLFIQHIMYSLKKENGRAAIVVPTGFITAQNGIEKKIREKLIEEKMLRGVVSMPSNIFATTGTSVSILVLDKGNTRGNIVLMDASNLGDKVKEGKNQKTVLSPEEVKLIINTFNKHEAKENFSVVVSYEAIAEKNYSFSAGQYFDVKIEYVDITNEEFKEKMNGFKNRLAVLFNETKKIEEEIKKQLEGINYGN